GLVRPVLTADQVSPLSTDLRTPPATVPMKIVPLPWGSTAMASTEAGLGPMLVQAPLFCRAISSNGERKIPPMAALRFLMVIFTSPPDCFFHSKASLASV